MEMSSHALEQERVWGIQVDVAIFTNLTQDHLDYHQTMDRYAMAKARLFVGIGTPPPRVAVVNEDDSYGERFMARDFEGEQLVLYGLDTSYGGGHYHAVDIQPDIIGTHYRWLTPNGSVDIHSPLTGRVNVYNLLAASCAALGRGLMLEEVARATERLQQVPGRFQLVPGSQDVGFIVVVDYAHTDDALRNLIMLGREQVAPHDGQVITLFGCGGDRDRTKRPKMGRAAGEDSEFVVLTSDNPRSEDPNRIIDEALAGVRETRTRYFVEPDRRAAIKAAIRLAKPGDIVLLAGKGHEKTQILATGAIPFDDVAEAELALRELKAKG